MANDKAPGAPEDWPDLPGTVSVDQLLAVVAAGTKADRADLTPGRRVEDLGIDSLDMIDILFEIEDKLGIYVSMTDGLTEAVFLGDFIKVLASQIDAAPVLSASPG